MRNPSSKAVWGAVLALVLLGPTSALASPGQSGKLDRALQGSSSSGEQRSVIIRVKAGRKAAVKSKVDKHTSQSHANGWIESITATLSPREIEEFLNDPDVEGVSIDADVTSLRGPSDQGGKRGKGAASSDTTQAGSSSSDVVGDVKQVLGLGNWYTGSSVTVAIIDSGVAPNLDFDTRILGQYVFTNGRLGEYSLPYDDYGHGTHIAGLIGSSGATSNNKYAGIAPGVKLLSLKVLDRKGTGKTSDVINALEFAVVNKNRFGIKVINLSLGHPIYESAKTDPLVQAVEAAVRAGIVVVVAAGNYGYNPITGKTGYAGLASPGNSPSAITVGASISNNTITRTDDRLASYSSRGPGWYDGIAKPDILAPGQALISNDAIGSTLDKDYPYLVLRVGFHKYLRLSGSSMATAVISGLAAVMIEGNQAGAQQRWQDYQSTLKRNQRTSFSAPPGLTSNALKAVFQYTATPLRDAAGVLYGPLEQGAGLVNGHGAIALAYHLDTTKRAGDYWMRAELAPSTNFGGTEEPWSQHVLWGTRVLRGSSVVEVRQVSWEDNIVWGTGELSSRMWGMFSEDEDNIVWGTLLDEDNIVWGTSIPPSTHLAWAGNAEFEDNIVWGTSAVWDDNVVWGDGLLGFFDGQKVVWGTFSREEDNIVWGTLDEDNIVWGTSANKVSVLGTLIGGAL